jgi:Zn ribbon nucleic-acid-binding protein
MQRDEEIVAMKKAKTVTISKRLFVGGPYTDCPQCGRKNTFGKSMMTAHRSYTKECVECPYKQTFALPDIKKKIIYLDQFVISNMMKALNPRSASYNKIRAEQPRWLKLYERLDTLLKKQLIICPDSIYHRDESVVGEHFDAMVRIYEHLSEGTTFFDHTTIERFQIAQHFKKYLDGKPNEPLELDATKMVHGDLHVWEGGFRVSVRHRPMPGEIDGLRRQRESSYASFLPIFERWKTEKNKSFSDRVLEEAAGLGKGLWETAGKFLRRKQELMQRLAQGGEMSDEDLNAVLPPQSNEILNDMIRVLNSRGVSGQDARDKINEYFNSPDLLNVPAVRLTSLMFAGIARQTALGRTNPPSRGMFNDVFAIGSLLPYCDAMFIDNEMAGLISNNPVRKEIGYTTKIFSSRTFSDFMSYLDSIETNADPKHLQYVADAYGETKPYMNILWDEHMGEE